ncbi:8-oxoguanine deaminase [Piscinibacter sakaiensis]|uniref:Guanine deaminase n=1 Tax=Piscinibacter sakaiensis TaxID=1547922 RepID=A0A0K8NXR6_PISS1|nr:8-oxoguanine deaminase [Piscinibacter sakaiensis]GAP35158.1 guanine deaminase [Piscinibacter sakaiensis]
MPTLLVRHAHLLATFDDAGREIPDGGLFARDGVIEAVGPSADLPTTADEVIDARGQLVLPGLVNTHHHMYQSLTRALPAAQDAELFDWLTALYPVWARLTPEMVRVSTQLALAELALSGCTTSSDHLYLFPNGCRLDDSLEAAEAVGLRFHAARGAMSVGRRLGGLPPDELVEDEAAILRDTQRLIERWHDPAPHAMRRIVVAPCSPFSVSEDLMRESVRLARSYGPAHRVCLHTHLAENRKDIDYTREKFGCTPAEYAERLGWLGPDVWCAHCVQLDAAGIAAFGRTGTGVAHCPGSNMRLGSGIAPLRAMQAAGVPVSIAVDGSASNDAGHLLGEARLALLLQRVGGAGAPLAAREVLAMATRGGARVLGRDDIGQLAPGQGADLITVPLDEIGLAGALHDPLAALLFCHVPRVATSIVAGRVVVRDGQLTTLDLPRLVERHNQLARQLVGA